MITKGRCGADDERLLERREQVDQRRPRAARAGRRRRRRASSAPARSSSRCCGRVDADVGARAARSRAPRASRRRACGARSTSPSAPASFSRDRPSPALRRSVHDALVRRGGSAGVFLKRSNIGTTGVEAIGRARRGRGGRLEFYRFAPHAAPRPLPSPRAAAAANRVRIIGGRLRGRVDPLSARRRACGRRPTACARRCSTGWART